MKRILIVVLVLLLCGAALAEDFMSIYTADMERAAELKEAATTKIESYSSIMYGGVLDRVEINANLGTDAGGDFIVLVYMSYPGKTDPKVDYNNLAIASVSISTAIKDTCPEAVELTVFWDLPQYDASAKITFKPDENGWDFDDIMVPKVMVG